MFALRQIKRDVFDRQTIEALGSAAGILGGSAWASGPVASWLDVNDAHIYLALALVATFVVSAIIAFVRFWWWGNFSG